MSVLLVKEIQKTDLFSIMEFYNSIKNHVFNDVMEFINHELCYFYGDYCEYLDRDFKDLCYDRDIETISDLFNTEEGGMILREYLNTDTIKNITGCLSYKDIADLEYYIDINEVRDIIKYTNDNIEELSKYLNDKLFQALPFICTWGGRLYDEINEDLNEDYNIKEIIKYIESEEIANNHDLAKYVINMFRG